MSQENNLKADPIREAFDRELTVFENEQSKAQAAILLSEAEKQLQALKDLRTKFLGKKSEHANEKKKIGGEKDPGKRRELAVNIQQREKDFIQLLDDAESF